MKSCMTSSLAFIAIATLFTSIALAQQAAPAAAQQPGPQQPAAPALTPNPEWTHQNSGSLCTPLSSARLCSKPALMLVDEYPRISFHEGLLSRSEESRVGKECRS